ncbi:MAG TPA: ATP-binding protein, partial [Chitinophaga sp.]|nr:ATP-binding protein [Chitinophaga sp.]
YFQLTRDTIRLIKGGKELYRVNYPQADPNRLFTFRGQLCSIEKNGRTVGITRNGVYPLRITGDLQALPHGWGTEGGPEIYWNIPAGQLFLYMDKACYKLELTDSFTLKTSLVLKGFDFPRNRIVTLYNDTVNRRLFLGSITKGLYVCSAQQFRGLKAGQEEDEVYYAQATFGKQGIVTPLGVALDPQTGEKTKIPLLSRKLPDRYSITRDQQGNYWYKDFTTLMKFSNDLGKLLWQQQLDHEIGQLYVDEDSLLWIGTKQGLYVMHTAEVRPEPKLYNADIDNISYILNDRHILWIGTGFGLFRIDRRTGKLDSIPQLNDRYIRSLYLTAPGEVWITTYNYGIFLYKDNHLIPLPTDENKYLEAAHCIVRDKQGYLWITTNKGLFQASYRDALEYAAGRQQTLFYLHYGKEQGFYTNEFNGGCEPCALQLQNGDISLPSLDGLVYFTPSSIHPELPGKGIFIDHMEVDTRTIAADTAVYLPNDFRHVRFSISTPYFGDPANLHLYYSLEEEGINNKVLWLPVADNRIIEFSSMHSGKYRLRIRKLNGFGKDNITEKVLTILVGKAFYETVWFRILVGVLLLFTGFALSWFRIRRVEKMNRELALRVAERTSELEEAMSTLQISEQQLRRQGFIQQRLIAAISHDLKTPLKYMMQVIGKGNEPKSEIGKDERKIIYESLYSMFHMVENLIQYMRSQFMDDVSSLEMVDLRQLLEEKANIFRVVARAREVEILDHTLPDTIVLVNRQLLAVVIHNLLDNAVKYTRKGYIQIQASCDTEQIRIRFADTGIGMPPAIINWITQYKEASSNIEGKPSSPDGIGLMMVIELLQLLNGDIAVTPNKDQGTIIDITLDVIR